MGKGYVIITHAKNEERNLPILAESMLKQTIKPAAWFVTDDGSDDRTPGIIEELASKFPWIDGKRLEKSHISNTKELDAHFIKLTVNIFNHAVDFCNREGIEYGYIGKVDADIVLPPDYFERVIEKFGQNPALGIAGGNYIFAELNERGDTTLRKTPRVILEDGPSGGCILIKRECFQEMGGIPPTTGAQDAAILAKARLCGWETKRFSNIEILHLRKRGSASWDGYIAYRLDLHPLLVLLNFLVSLFRRETFRGLAYLYSYSVALLKREPKVTDDSLRYYFRHKRLEEVKKLVSLKVNTKLKNLGLRKRC